MGRFETASFLASLMALQAIKEVELQRPQRRKRKKTACEGREEERNSISTGRTTDPAEATIYSTLDKSRHFGTIGKWKNLTGSLSPSRTQTAGQSY
jgi:hypothetical protein